MIGKFRNFPSKVHSSEVKKIICYHFRKPLPSNGIRFQLLAVAGQKIPALKPVPGTRQKIDGSGPPARIILREVFKQLFIW